MIAKIAFEKQIHLFRGQIDFKRLKNHCQSVFKVLPKSFEFYYIDSDGDKINLNSQQDLDAIYESDDKPGIKKFFIQGVQTEFQQLQDNSNPEECQQLNQDNFCYLPSKYCDGIRTTNIVKNQMSKKEEDYIKRQSFMFLAELQRKIVDKIVEEEQQVIREEVAKFIQYDLQERVVEKIIREEEQIIKESVAKEVDSMISNFVSNLLLQEENKCQSSKAQTKQMGIQSGYEVRLHNISRNQALIDKLVEQKLKKIMPGLIKQVVRSVEAKITLNGCMKCCSQKQQMGILMTRKYGKKYREC